MKRPLVVGAIVRYVCGRNPKWAGFEGPVEAIDGDHARVRFAQCRKGGPVPEEPVDVGAHEVRVLRAHSKGYL